MKQTFIITVLFASLAFGCSTDDEVTSDPATTSTDAVDTTDATDANDAIDGADTADATDATDGIDGSDSNAACTLEGECCVFDTITCDSPITADNIDGARSIGDYPCDEYNVDYAAFPEMVYKFTATADTKIDPSIVSTLLFDLFIVPESEGTCNLAGCTLDPANVEEVTEVPAGTTLYFVVEHWQGQTGEFTLDLGCCTPTCGEKTCGDDGCGGTCGTCDAGQTCSPDGACLSNECSPVRALTCGESFTVDTAGPDSTNSTLEHGCGQYEDVYSGPEVAYSFSSDTETEVTIDAPEVNGVEDDGVDVIAIKDQGDGVCDMQFCESSGINTAVFFSAPSDTHYVVFDGYAGASQSELSVGVTCCFAECDGKVCGDDGCGNSCASCPALEACSADQTACVTGQFAGNGTCDTAEIITALPFVGIGSTAGATADYSTLNAGGDAALPGCAGIPTGGKDVVYSYTAIMNGTIEVWLEQVPDDESVCADPINDAGCTPKTLNIVTSCPDTADFAGCSAGVDYLANGTPFPTRAQVDVIANTTYLIIISGYNANEEGPYKLLVDVLEGSGSDGTDASDGSATAGDDGGTDTSDGMTTAGDDGGTDTSDGMATAGDDGGTGTSDGMATTGSEGGTAGGEGDTAGSEGGTAGSEGGTTGDEGGTAGSDGSATDG